MCKAPGILLGVDPANPGFHQCCHEFSAGGVFLFFFEMEEEKIVIKSIQINRQINTVMNAVKKMSGDGMIGMIRKELAQFLYFCSLQFRNCCMLGVPGFGLTSLSSALSPPRGRIEVNLHGNHIILHLTGA